MRLKHIECSQTPPLDCALCLQNRELRDSHLVPKALYRLARALNRPSKPDPVLLTSSGRKQTSFRASQYLLCADCEATSRTCFELILATITRSTSPDLPFS